MIFALAAWAAPGPELAAAAGCNQCHLVPEVAAAPRTASCTLCHAWIHEVAADSAKRAVAMRVFPNWTRYEHNVRSYAAVPDLGAAFARLEPAWLDAYLADPYDLRPAMPETMVRLGLGEADRATLVAWAAELRVEVPATPAPDPARVDAGRRLFGQRGCDLCHSFGARVASPGIAAAPDLRHVRDRMRDDAIVAWIRDPRAVSAAATMPSQGISEADAIALRDYLVLADPGGVAPAPRAPEAAPAPASPPGWAEVEARVFGRICAHCHMDPAQNEGRGGPGNLGGYGWAATGIELQTAAGARRHQDAVLAAIDRRYAEEARDHVGPGEIPLGIERPALPGMPLGLPALPPEDVALVRAWYAAGAPD